MFVSTERIGAAPDGKAARPRRRRRPAAGRVVATLRVVVRVLGGAAVAGDARVELELSFVARRGDLVDAAQFGDGIRGSSTRRSRYGTTVLHMTRTAADWRPRASPPASCPASSTAIALAEVRGARLVKGALHRLDGRFRDEDVAGDRVARTPAPAAPRVGVLAGVGEGAALGVDDVELPVRRIPVVGERRRRSLVRRRRRPRAGRGCAARGRG